MNITQVNSPRHGGGETPAPRTHTMCTTQSGSIVTLLVMEGTDV